MNTLKGYDFQYKTCLGLRERDLCSTFAKEHPKETLHHSSKPC